MSYQIRSGDLGAAANLLAGCEEQRELGLGYAVGTKQGTAIGPKLIAEIIRAHADVPQLHSGNYRHIEELQLVVTGLAEDRISDTAFSIIKDFFIDYTASQARQLKVPTRSTRLGNVYDSVHQTWIPAAPASLPFDPSNDSPILLAPLDLLRHLPWIHYLDYYRSYYAPRVAPANFRRGKVAKAAVLAYNARNYVEVERYVDEKERTADSCKPDPLFRPFSTATLT